MADRTDTEIAQALALRAGAELVNAVVENPKTRRAAEKLCAALMLATSAAEAEQAGKVVRLKAK